MADRLLKDLSLGTQVYVYETVSGTTTPVPYLVVRQKSNGITCIERVNAPGQRRINPTANSVYKNSEMDEYLNDSTDGFLSRFSAAMLSCLEFDSIPVYSFGDASPEYISRKCYLGSYGEFFLDDTQRTAVEPENNDPEISYQILKGTLTLNNARKCVDDGGTAVLCWLRSPYSAASVYYISTNGASNYNVANGTYGFRPRLSVSNDTIVSPEGSTDIYLFPDERTYNVIDFDIEVGDRNTKPVSGVAKFNTVNLYDVTAQICCNYGSSNEVWVNVTSGSVVNFPLCEKTTDKWVIGFRLFGKSSGSGSCDEPVVYTI